jgi:hypothetical protein
VIDNTKARGLQEIYKASGNGALNALAQECQGIAFVIVKAQCRRYGLRFEREKIEEFSYDAAAQFIAQYLKHADYNVRNFSARIRRDVLNVMFGRARNKQDSFEDGQLQHDDCFTDEPAPGKEAINPTTALDELVADHPQGKKIAADLYRSKSYSQAIRRIAAYVGRDWIYAHAEKMHFIFRAFRWHPRADRGILGSGPRRVLQGVLPSEQAEREQLGERAGEIPTGRNGVKT